MFTLSQLLDLINAYLSEELEHDRSPRNLYEPVNYVLAVGGKRIRPVLLMMAYNLYKDDVSNILSCATAIEMYHNYTLLHDDLMDRADMRRGKKTVHRVWDDNTAILSGDAMLVLAYQYICSSNPEHLKEILDLFSFTALQICEGQQLDMDFELRCDVTENEYIEMIRLKTAVLLAASLKIGAILGGGSKKDSDLLYNVGLYTGLAFQLKDDLLDVYGDPVVFGKKNGGDILCNKKTFLLIKSLEIADDHQSFELNKWINASSYIPEEKIIAVKNIYDEIEIKGLCEKKISFYYEKALDSLSKITPIAQRRERLEDLIRVLMLREV
ncbi:MAG: (2E,6E)-farnesyl diphosphate synthase [Bacteroidetes bacterium]|nr:(2E,6E)-farnesyl diphosphate synthase [Bacteroidota bacterium]